jgi:hypothetical protein
MTDYFKNKENNRLFYFWLSNHPESFHQLDMERFYDFILNLFSTGEELTTYILTNAVNEVKKWVEETTNEFVETFIDKYFELKRFWDYAIKKQLR